MKPRLIVNCATTLMALSWRSARLGAAQACQYVVPTIREPTRTSPATARREICWFIGRGPFSYARPRVRAVGHEQEPGEQHEVRDDAGAAVADERQCDPGQRDQPDDAAHDDERLEGEAERQPDGDQLREPVLGQKRDPEPARREEHVDEQKGRDPDQPELLRKRRVDEVGADVGDELVAVGVSERALAEAGPAEVSVGDRVDRLDRLVAAAVGIAPRVEPHAHPLRDAPDLRVHERRAAHEHRHPGGDEPHLRGRHIEHREEDPEVEEPTAEVVREDENGHRSTPDEEERAEILEPCLSQHLTLLAQVAGEEDDQEDLRELARLEPHRTHLDPQAGPVHSPTDHGHRRQREEHERADAEEVLVGLEAAVVAAQRKQRAREGGEPDAGQEAGHGQQVRVGVRHRDPRDEMRHDIEAEEEERVRKRLGAHNLLARDVHARERGADDRADEDQAEQLAGAETHRLSRSQRIAAAANRSAARAAATGSARPRRFGFSSGSRVSMVGTPSSSDSVSSSTSPSTAGAAAVTAVSSSGSPSVTSKKTTVMLSSPPTLFAAPTRALAASSRLSRCFLTARMIVSSSTMSVSPSEQMRNRSPGSGRISKVSTSTSASVPTARVITERCGCDSASSSEILPLRTSSATSEWSSVSCSRRPSRSR